MKFLKMEIFKTNTYLYKNGFFIDIQKNAATKDIYIFHCDYGVKMLCFGLDNNIRDKKIIEMLENQIEKYIDIYKTNYMEV